jgi:hypothetical protein
MNPKEIATIIGMVKALCPAQRFDEFTPDAWELVLEDYPFPDAKTALKKLGGQLRFISPADIAAEIRRVRNLRAEQYRDYSQTLPDWDPDDVPGYLRAQRAQLFRAASELPARPVQQAIESHFVYVESKWSRQLAPLRAIEAPKPADPEFDAARATLAALPPTRVQQLMAAAREQLEADDVPLDHRAVAIRAAELATTHTTETATA